MNRAVASGLGQVLSVLVLLSHFVRKKGELRIALFQIDFSLMRKICKRGAPEAATQFTTPVNALCYNIVLARLIGDIGVSAFSILSFIFSLANAILSCVAHGVTTVDFASGLWYLVSRLQISAAPKKTLFSQCKHKMNTFFNNH